MGSRSAAPSRIFLTGAGGFVGRHLLARLTAAFPAARVLATSETEAAGITRLDVTDAAAVRNAVADFRPDAVVHLAALASAPQANRDVDRAWRVNFRAPRILARAVLETVPAASFLFISSAMVYGRSFRSHGPLTEVAPLEPRDTYAATKAAAEMALCAMVSEGLRLIRLRPFNHIGPGQSTAYAVASFAAQIARIEASGQPPELAVGALDAVRDFVDVRDICAAYAACLERQEMLESGVAINLASGVGRRIGAVLDELLALSRVPIKVRTEEVRLRPIDLPQSLGDPALAARLLGWRPATPWQTTLADILADARSRAGRR